MAKRVADVVVETLQAAGVKRCWGVPGDTLNFVTDAIRRSPIEWVHVRHEEVAGFAAGAEAMLTGDLTACAGSCGFCDEIRSPAQAQRKTAMAAQAALSKRGVAVLILPIDVSKADAPEEPAFAVHVSEPVIRPSDADLDELLTY